MGEFIYCVSNPAQPGIINIDAALNDPREQPTRASARAFVPRIEWVLRVADAAASKRALDQALAPFSDGKWPEYFRCDPMRARAAAIKFTNVRMEEESNGAAQPALPSLVLGLGLSVQFLEMMQGATGPSYALMAAALFWSVYTLPFGSRDKMPGM